MKFSHISDTHLGLVQYGLGEREQDIYDSFNQAIDISINDKVDFVIFAGDVFHTPTPSGTAILQMAKNCAYDLAKYNIRVNTVCAGTVETPISQVERESHGWTFEEWEKLKVKDVILRRVGNTREVANATLFYASSESSYCTGGFLMVDGGQTSCTVMAD